MRFLPFLLLLVTYAFAQEPTDSLLALRSDDLVFLVDPQIGGRVASVRYKGVELLATTRDEAHLKWGSTLWPSPQSAWDWPPPVVMDQGPYQVVMTSDRRIVLESPPNAYQGIQVRKRFSLVNASDVELMYTFVNQADTTIELGLWENSRIEYRGRVIWLSYERLDNDLPGLRQSPLRDTLDLVGEVAKTKLFIRTASGWLRYEKDGVYWMKYFQPLRNERLAPEHAQIEIYLDSPEGFAELEQHSPFIQLEPGEAATWRVRWTFGVPESAEE